VKFRIVLFPSEMGIHHFRFPFVHLKIKEGINLVRLV